MAQLSTLGVRATRFDFMKYIALPSGNIINLDQVAFVDSPGLGSSQQDSDAVLRVHFAAVSYAATKFGAGGGSLQLSLTGDDIAAFLAEMKVLGLNTDAAAEAVRKKRY